MAGELAYLDQWTGPTPPRSVWNALIQELHQRALIILGGSGEDGVPDHPWKASIDRWDDEAARSYPVPDAQQLWRVDLVGGMVNEQIPTIAYQAVNDPRGWKPTGKQKTGTVRRSVFERTDPPFFVLETPPVDQKATSNKHFTVVTDGQRPSFFRTEDQWPRQIFRATMTVTGVLPPLPDLLLNLPPNLLSSTPTSLTGLLAGLAIDATLASISIADLPKVRLINPPFQLACGRAPSSLLTPFAPIRLLAEFWLSRDPDLGLAGDEIHVGQRECYDLTAASVLDGASLLELVPLLESQGLLGQLTAQEIFTQLYDTARALWWSR